MHAAFREVGEHCAVDVRQSGGFGHGVRDVDPEAVDAAVEPEPHDPVEFSRHFRVLPVQVRLLWSEQVQIPLAGPPVSLDDAVPGRPAER